MARPAARSPIHAATGLSILLALAGGSWAGTAWPEASAPPHRTAGAGDGTCVHCHAGIEEMHPGFPLSCVDCHGGDPTATTREQAHVQPRQPWPNDERVLPQNHDPAYVRFRNPSNLRVAREVCGDCHGEIVDRVLKSLHATTTGHLGDGFYENGVTDSKVPTYSVFPVRDDDGEIGPHALRATVQVPGFDRRGPKDRIETHYTDLARKACMHCHLWSEGRAVDGRLGLDGDYRGEGCAACHVTYADDGRSRSRDRSADRLEPGHPVQHRMTSAIPTETCTRCHYGDASIGLHFRGLAQLVPGMPAGPQVPGTTDTLLNGTFYIRDRDMTPPDVHHQAGMHCIDCHTSADAMGDGDIHPQMDHAVEIECTSCHGTIDAVSDLMTDHGRRVPNLHRAGDEFWLVSKVTGARHRVKQAKHVVTEGHADYNAAAAAAMTADHGRLECYTCHNGWNVNFFGFHFDRNEQFTQLDLISGERTPGRVTTQEKVFATFNQLRLGFNHEGAIAPYMVGFSTIGSAHGRDGETILYQETPETAAGLSGVSLVPHDPHSTRPEARSCVECHRAPTTWGLASTNFRLTREFGFALSGRGLHAFALDMKTPQRSAAVAELPLGDDLEPRALALRLDPVHARATHAFVADAAGGLTAIDLSNPVLPRVLGRGPLLTDPRRMRVDADRLYVADGAAGLRIFDVDRPGKPAELGSVPTVEARAVHVAWPWALVADGPGGLAIVDVTDPRSPEVVAAVDLNGESSLPNDATDVAVLFQYSRTRAVDERGTRLERTPARHLAYVACGLDGVRIVDFTEPAAPVLLDDRRSRQVLSFPRGDVRGIAVNTVFDIGSEGGGLRSGEHEYLYALAEQGPDDNRQRRVAVFDVSDPLRPRRVRGNPRVYGGTGQLAVVRAYNAPFLQHFAVAVGAGGTGTLIEVGKTRTEPAVEAIWDDLGGVVDMAFEEFAFDGLQDGRGRWHKDISHADCRYLTADEIRRVLAVPLGGRDEPQGRYGSVGGDRSQEGGR